MKKGFKVFLAASLGSCVLTMTSYAGSWQADGANWRYQNDDASYAAGGWAAINDNWYYFDADGYMKTGWVLDNQSWYYLNPSGEMRRELCLKTRSPIILIPSAARVPIRMLPIRRRLREAIH
ncbi:N-acetylmuramoyl-L-alanine amidase family protein [Enterocloster asparagiformis]|uniref:N-acetylmuramoyl-L-alanine amidase family protein n=1 Tax=Enterocloster asparagiformis TaxID=333367 RepID=UPI000463BD36|nr:hypothetical protein [Enterocloster asparagiformis]